MYRTYRIQLQDLKWVILYVVLLQSEDFVDHDEENSPQDKYNDIPVRSVRRMHEHGMVYVCMYTVHVKLQYWN